LAKTSAAPNGRLRGWARSDARGEYRFDTIRPGPYPGRPAPQHIHMHVLEVGRCTYYIGDVMFTDDPRLTAELRASAARDRAGSGVVTPERDANGVWQAERDIRLGLNVPGYDACD
jgi:protocatechuate 3,4-dioxygenase beta subunit